MRTALFIDGPNLYATANTLGVDIDYKRLLKYYGDGLVRAYYYTAVVEDPNLAYSSIRPLIDWLEYNGYTLVSKPAKEFHDPATNRVKIKGNMDCELTVDMLELTPMLDHVVLFSGDGDFKPLLAAVKRKGVRVTVVSSIKMSPPMCADELRREADIFVDLADLAEHITRVEHQREPVIRRPSSGQRAVELQRSRYSSG